MVPAAIARVHSLRGTTSRLCSGLRCAPLGCNRMLRNEPMSRASMKRSHARVFLPQTYVSIACNDRSFDQNIKFTLILMTAHEYRLPRSLQDASEMSNSSRSLITNKYLALPLSLHPGTGLLCRSRRSRRRESSRGLLARQRPREGQGWTSCLVLLGCAWCLRGEFSGRKA